jgi:hypothetical protein
MTGEPAAHPPAATDVSTDAALIVAALGRMEAAVRDERATLGRLRASLGEMAEVIARAKAVADSETAATLLDEFEHRVDAMIEMAGGEASHIDDAPAPQSEPAEPAAEQATEQGAVPAAESDQVPTVSGVVLLLGPPGDTVPEPAVMDTPQPTASAGDKAPTVAMLTAMVEALSASIQAPAPEPEAAAEAAPPAPLPVATVRETDLIASFEQMGVRPFPPPDEGTAVIFEPRPAPQLPPEPAPEPPAPPPTVEPAPPESAAIAADAALPVASEAMPFATVEEPAAEAVPSAEIPPAAEPATVTPPSDAASAEADFDPTDFLFGPEPEPDPAAFLLDPAPPAELKAVMLPQPEFIAPPPPAQNPGHAPEGEAPQPAPAAEAGQPAPPEPQPPPHDPLHALKAMSPEERLALFS